MKLSSIMFVWMCALEVSVASAAQTLFPAIECSGCGASQMQQAALRAPLGIVFIYDIDANIVRKYDVLMDSTCLVPPQVEGLGGQPATGASHPACGPERAAEPMSPVDPDVQAVFGALVQAYRVNPVLVLQAAARYQASVPVDPHTGRPFDLVNVAWEYPQGTYDRFRDHVVSELGSEQTANGFSPGLGTYLYSWQQHSRTVEISGGSGAVVSGSITWDRNNTTTVSICDVENVCAVFSVTNNHDSGPVDISFAGVKDSQGNYYPSPNVPSPDSPRWTWRPPYGGGAGESFSNGLRGNGVEIMDSTDGCGPSEDYFLRCAWRGRELMSCQLSCY